MRQTEFIGKALQPLRFFQRVQVFALDIFDQRHDRCSFVGHVLDEHRHLVQSGQSGGSHPAFASDDFVAVRPHRAHQNRLHHALRLDALGKLIQRTLVHARARLVFAGLQLAEVQGAR